MLTDNLMLKNDAVVIEDYSKLNALKYKIENYAMMQDKEIKETVLWESYLTYAISFGIAGKIANKIKPMIHDEDLTRLLENDKLLDYVLHEYSYFDMHMRSKSVDRMLNTVDKVSKYSGGSSSGGGFSGGSGGGFSRRRRLFWRRWSRWWRRRILRRRG